MTVNVTIAMQGKTNRKKIEAIPYELRWADVKRKGSAAVNIKQFTNLDGPTDTMNATSVQRSA